MGPLIRRRTFGSGFSAQKLLDYFCSPALWKSQDELASFFLNKTTLPSKPGFLRLLALSYALPAEALGLTVAVFSIGEDKAICKRKMSVTSRKILCWEGALPNKGRLSNKSVVCPKTIRFDFREVQGETKPFALSLLYKYPALVGEGRK
jgi:hypothetical protein